MSFRYGILNLLVLVIIILLASRTYKAWTTPVEMPPEKEGPRRRQKFRKSVFFYG
jgi:hypothetical protein